MNFDLTDDQQKRYDDTLEAVRYHLDGEPEQGAEHIFTRTRWKEAARLGLTSLCVPDEFGGGGLGALDTSLSLEAFGRGCADTGLVFAVAAHLLACAVPIRDFAGPGVREELLGGLASGELIAANAMTEDDAGSDIGRLDTVARRDGDGRHGQHGEESEESEDGRGYVLDGEKSFASNAPAADVIVTYATTDARAGFLGLTAFAVPRELPGVSVGEPLRKMGLHGCPAGRVAFTACRVPASHRLGTEGQGAAVFQHSMAWERACLFACYLGMMERQLERCVEHAQERRQFGRAISGFQAVSHRIAVMRQRLDAARLLLRRACWLLDEGRDNTLAVALAKVSVSEAAVANSLDAVQIFGGAGFLAPTGIERNLRDAVPSTIFSGTTEVQRELIAREMGL
ncbi:acyl-CoA dehydrogenase family protein [Actinomadura sp. 9N215]|uniref:acyl-CoA dehydrogenase family protein n=1 Tax=Actinomadura sp. 9N215 TaxID=3375150 RepID=UPI0037A2EDA5